jgi:hypothetical protein
MTAFHSEYRVTKANEHQTLFGWLNVSTEPDGTDVVDSDGQNIPIGELERAAYAFLKSVSAPSGVDHDGGDPDGEMVASVVFTDDVLDALSVDPATGEPIEPLRKALREHMPRGWFGAFHIADEAAWVAARDGDRQAFSVEGYAGRMEKADD